MLVVSGLLCSTLRAAGVDLILHHGRVVSVDPAFSIYQAVAAEDRRIFKVGTDEAVLAVKGSNTELVDLGGKLVPLGWICHGIRSHLGLRERRRNFRNSD